MPVTLTLTYEAQTFNRTISDANALKLIAAAKQRFGEVEGETPFQTFDRWLKVHATNDVYWADRKIAAAAVAAGNVVEEV